MSAEIEKRLAEVDAMDLRELADELDKLVQRGVKWEYLPVLMRARDELRAHYALRGKVVAVTAELERLESQKPWWKTVLRALRVLK